MGIDWQASSEIVVYTLGFLLCITGFLLSCLSLSGTWLVLAAAGLAAWINWPDFPGIGTLITFLLLCVGVEIAEGLAGAWGVQKRGGSRAAGWAAVGGGLLGMVLGTFIPIPILGNLIGMALGSFGGAFLVEHARMKKTAHAAHVATGAVLARVGVIFLKVGVTVIMTFVLVVGLVVS